MEDRKTAWEMIVPKDRSTKIWRYMDIAQFISILSKKSLWFSSAAKFDDPFEGSHSKKYIELMEKLTNESSDQESLIKLAKELPKFTFINCWHICSTENYGMWKVYGKNNHSIAIQTTYDKFYGCLKSYQNIVISVVDYKDYEKDQLNPTGSTELIPYFNKINYFEYENELRAIIQHTEKIKAAVLSGSECTQEQANGLSIKIDVAALRKL